jgi:hypothetical protein
MLPKIPGFLYDENGFIVGKDEDYYRNKNGGATAPPEQDASEPEVGSPDPDDQQIEIDEFDETIDEYSDDNNEIHDNDAPVPEKSFRLRKFPVKEQEDPKPKPIKRRRIVYRQPQMMYQQPGMPYIPPPINADWQPQPERPYVENPEITLVHNGMNKTIRNLIGSNHGIYLPGVNAPMVARPQGGGRKFRRSRRSRRG